MTGFLGIDLGGRFARRERRIGERLPYARHLDAATLETRDGQLLQVIRVAGLPFETADDEELAYRKQVRETVLRALSTP
ncbi:hypothetical protein ABTN05_19690, partial [Acinetobacter baumannii]